MTKDKDNLTLSDIRTQVTRRAQQIEELRDRVEALGREVEDLLEEIAEIEGRKTRRKRMTVPEPPEEDLGDDDLARTPRADAAEKPRRRRRSSLLGARPRPPKREGPSAVDVAVEILREHGRPMDPAELSVKVEERGVVTKNTERVILMAAGRKKSRLTKTDEGTIALSGDAAQE